MCASSVATICVGLVHVAYMALALATAQPVLDLGFALARFAFAYYIKVLDLERHVTAELACIAYGIESKQDYWPSCN